MSCFLGNVEIVGGFLKGEWADSTVPLQPSPHRVNGGVKVSHLAEQKCLQKSLVFQRSRLKIVKFLIYEVWKNTCTFNFPEIIVAEGKL